MPDSVRWPNLCLAPIARGEVVDIANTGDGRPTGRDIIWQSPQRHVTVKRTRRSGASVSVVPGTTSQSSEHHYHRRTASGVAMPNAGHWLQACGLTTADAKTSGLAMEPAIFGPIDCTLAPCRWLLSIISLAFMLEGCATGDLSVSPLTDVADIRQQDTLAGHWEESAHTVEGFAVDSKGHWEIAPRAGLLDMYFVYEQDDVGPLGWGPLKGDRVHSAVITVTGRRISGKGTGRYCGVGGDDYDVRVNGVLNNEETSMDLVFFSANRHPGYSDCHEEVVLTRP